MSLLMLSFKEKVTSENELELTFEIKEFEKRYLTKVNVLVII